MAFFWHDVEENWERLGENVFIGLDWNVEDVRTY